MRNKAVEETEVADEVSETPEKQKQDEECTSVMEYELPFSMSAVKQA